MAPGGAGRDARDSASPCGPRRERRSRETAGTRLGKAALQRDRRAGECDGGEGKRSETANYLLD